MVELVPLECCTKVAFTAPDMMKEAMADSVASSLIRMDDA
jgi:hypothetical protein